MTWLTFRQFRAQAIAALAALAVLGIAFGTTGPHLVRLYDASGMRGCGNRPVCLSRASTFIDALKADQVYPALFFAGLVSLVILPAIIGAFWGAPLVARELETGTYRLAWNQDVTRTRWMAIKLGGVGLAAIATSGLLSLLFSWWAGPINAAGGFPDNFSEFVRMTPLMFASQGIVPAAWSALAFVLGVVAGLLACRTIPAMAITIVVVALLQILWPHFVRPHLLTPDRATAPITAVSLNSMLVSNHSAVTVAINQPGTAHLPGAWVVGDKSVTRSGGQFFLPGTPTSICAKGSPQQCQDWIASHHLTQVVDYLPASSFWSLQWIEAGLLLVLAAGLGAVATWRIRHVLT